MTTRKIERWFLVLVAVVFGGLVMTACGAEANAPADPAPVSAAAAAVRSPAPASTKPPTATLAPTVKIAPTSTPVVGLQLTPLFVGPQISATVTSFTDIPGNLADGSEHVTFRAVLMDRGPVSAADWQGSYLLLIPSVAGCGECMVNLYELTQVYSDYKDANVQVAFLSIYPGDTPDVWRPLAENFPDLSIQWGTIDPNFVVDYNVQGLGTVLMIDPQGRLVFRSNSPLQAVSYRQLLALTSQAAQN
jgi:hypothetical protein